MAVDWTQAQAAVIGSALIDGRCAPEILAEMREEDFSGSFLQFFRALRDLSAEQTPVDVVTVLAKLGPEYRDIAKDLLTMTPTAANVSAYIAACKEQSRLKLLRDIGLELSGAVTLDAARETLGRAAAISMESIPRRRMTAMELAASWINAVNTKEKPEFIQTGIGCLDQIVHTVPGNYHIIAGHTSHGKSTLAIQIAQHIAQTKNVGYFSLELKDEEFRDRVIAMGSGADQEHVQSRELTEDEIRSTGRAAGEIFKLKQRFNYEPAAGFTVDDIRAVTLQYGYEVIFVDYLQAVTTNGKNERFQGVLEITRGLQTLAYKLGVTVFAMSQVTDPNTDDDFLPVPTLSMLRESKQIGMDADAVIVIHAPLRKQMPRFRVLDVAKNRTGRTDRFFIDFDGSRQKFSAPSVEDSRIWSEVMHKRRALKANELAELKAEMEARRAADQKRALENEAKKRYKAKANGGEQMQMEEAKP